ncbi:MAG: hypothetical protein HYS89_00840 [Candidatus Colwellbacteria bacterium]|nr:hypothetical protein [Candidatus Colwellbacteria bacterium]
MEEEYLEEIKRRGKESRVYEEHQLVGLLLAEILEDEEHKSLYMKLAKEHETDFLFKLAKSVAERKRVKKKGAYFMRILTQIGKKK